MPSFVLVSSARLGGDTLRLPLTTEEWLAETLLGTTAPSFVPRLGPNQQLVLVSPEIEVEPGSSASSRAAPLGPQEFVCFELSFMPSPAGEAEPQSRVAPQALTRFARHDVPQLELHRINDEDLGGFLTVRKAEGKEWRPFAFPVSSSDGRGVAIEITE